jgi:hypothetical protein
MLATLTRVFMVFLSSSKVNVSAVAVIIILLLLCNGFEKWSFNIKLFNAAKLVWGGIVHPGHHFS